MLLYCINTLFPALFNSSDSSSSSGGTSHKSPNPSCTNSSSSTTLTATAEATTRTIGPTTPSLRSSLETLSVRQAEIRKETQLALSGIFARNKTNNSSSNNNSSNNNNSNGSASARKKEIIQKGEREDEELEETFPGPSLSKGKDRDSGTIVRPVFSL